MFEQITILSPGLLGSSLAWACRERALAKRIHVWARRPEVRLECEEQVWCDAVFGTPEAATENADLVVLCMPVEVIPSITKRISSYLKAGAIVTDVGSTKGILTRFCHEYMPEGATFIGSHPMAGSEKGGMDFADPLLFECHPCFITPLTETPVEFVEKMLRFWRELGMEVSTTTPELHDEIVANISHLPHVLASALSVYLKQKDPAWRNFAGNGLKDTTRIASGGANLWKSIIQQNRDEILRSMDGLDSVIQQFRSYLANEEWLEIISFLEQGKSYRDSFRPESIEKK